MARIRQLKPEFWTDEKIAKLSRDARLLFLGLWTEADDDGRLVDSAKLLAGSLFPFDDDVTARLVGRWLDEIVALGLVCRYEAKGATYLHVVNFPRHQKIAHPRKSSLPTPEGCTHSSCDPPESVVSTARNPQEEIASGSGGSRYARAGGAPADQGVKGSRGQGVKSTHEASPNGSATHAGKLSNVEQSRANIAEAFADVEAGS